MQLHHLILILILLLSLTPSSSSTSPSPSSSDITTLLTFKSLVNSSLLSSWSSSTSPCSSWLFISCHPLTHQISHLHLSNLSTTLPIPSSTLLLLSHLSSLRLLSLPSLPLSGPLPSSLPSSLRFLLLPHNLLSGPIPPTLLPSLPKLAHLDLSFNLLSGPIPTFYPPLHLRLLNLSSNSLSGPIPSNLSALPPSSFLLNPHLCGPPLPNHCDSNFAESKPEVAPAANGGGGGMSRMAVVAIVVGDFAALVVVSLVLFCYFWRKFAGRGVPEGEKIVYSSSPYVGIGNNYNVGGGGGNFGERGKMVVFEGTRRFELEDLLRASAEMLGKGGMGTAYKAVLDDGNAVAVKRLREVVGGGGGRREFDAQMELIGRMRHPNLVALKGYYYARDEKLLVYEFMAGGSLFALLHGKMMNRTYLYIFWRQKFFWKSILYYLFVSANRGPGRTPLDWTTRMRIAVGTARGLAYIHHHHHSTSKSSKLVHGNIKSTNILLDKSNSPKLADYALVPLFPPPPPPPRSQHGYTAPETMLDPRRQFTQKADIYAFGVVLLEILTGKMVSEEVDLALWVQSVVREEWTAEVFDLELMRYKGVEEEMVGMLQVAMACVAVAPEQRPKIGQVLKMIEEIRSEGSPSAASYESYGESTDQSPCVSDETGTIVSI